MRASQSRSGPKLTPHPKSHPIRRPFADLNHRKPVLGGVPGAKWRNDFTVRRPTPSALARRHVGDLARKRPELL